MEVCLVLMVFWVKEDCWVMESLTSQHTSPGKSEQKHSGDAHCGVTNSVQRTGSPKGVLQGTRSSLLHKPPVLGSQLM